MPSPLLLIQTLLDRKIVTAEDETEGRFQDIAAVEEGHPPSRRTGRGFLSRLIGYHDAMSSEACTEGVGPSSSPDRDRHFAGADVVYEEDEDDQILDTEEPTPPSNGTDGMPGHALPPSADTSVPLPNLMPSNTPPSQAPRKCSLRPHDEENGGGESSGTTNRGDGFAEMNRYDTRGSTSTWPSMTPPRTLGPIPKALKKTKAFIFQTNPEGDQAGNKFILNYRYMPILSGVLSPFAILLEIPGLTEHWYIRTENHQVVESRQNPKTNLALIARFLEHEVIFNTCLAMVVLIIHDIINIIVVTVFGVIHRFDDGFTYGEAFWMCVCSTIFSVTVTATLAYDFFTTHDFAENSSGLTRKQRSLVIMVMILLCYIALGSGVFAELIGLTFQDGLYYTVVSIETIGFGDITPNNTGSTLFCIFYSTIGIITVWLVVNTTRETIMEAFENVYLKGRRERKAMRAQQGESYLDFKKRMQMQERKEFKTKVTTAIAKVQLQVDPTIGYGDIVPKSPAGRAVFIVWALMGVAAMSILIAVLTEGYGSRYKHALQNGLVHKAIKSVERREEARKEKSQEKNLSRLIDLANEVQHEIELQNAQSPSDLAQKILDRTRRHLDPITSDVVITHAKKFHDHVRYFANHTYPPEPPASLKDLLDEIVESEEMDERVKQELLGDDDARKTLFFISYERAFHKLIDTAERAVEIIKVKDIEWERLVKMLKERDGKFGNSAKYDAPAQRQQRTTSTTGMTALQKEKSKNDEEVRDEKPARRFLGLFEY
ncbi:hypothetical protein FRC04_010343 [Tulasnella sp. 424]|nr:hypothetical protein FRC04_010343 [Tulasnella sp. 424]